MAYTQTNKVFERRSAANLLNYYSPTPSNKKYGDGYIGDSNQTNPIPGKELFWYSWQYNPKKPFKSIDTDAYFPDSNNTLKIKSLYWLEKYEPPYLYYSLKFNSNFRSPFGGSSSPDPNSIGKVEYNYFQPSSYIQYDFSGYFYGWYTGYDLSPSNFGYNSIYGANFSALKNYWGFIFDMKPNWGNWIPKTKAELWQFEQWIQDPPNSGFYKCMWTKYEWNYVGIVSNGYGRELKYLETATRGILKDYDPLVPRWRTKWTPDQDDPEFVKMYYPGTNPYFSLMYYKQSGSDILLSNISQSYYVNEIYNGLLGDQVNIVLRYNLDSTQTEFQIQNNQLNNQPQYGVKNSLDSNYYPDSGLSSYKSNSTDDSPFYFVNKKTTYNLLCHKIYGCQSACWHKNKVLKIKLKWEIGQFQIIKYKGSMNNYYSTKANIHGEVSYSGQFEEEIMDDIEIKFDGDNLNVNVNPTYDQGIIKTFEIECQPGQAKRLVDICVLEVRDKT